MQRRSGLLEDGVFSLLDTVKASKGFVLSHSGNFHPSRKWLLYPSTPRQMFESQHIGTEVVTLCLMRVRFLTKKPKIASGHTPARGRRLL